MAVPSFKLANNGIERNPLGLEPNFRHRQSFTPYVVLQETDIRTTSQLPGAVRRFWQAVARYTGAPRTFNPTANAFDGPSPRGKSDATTKLNWTSRDLGSAILHYGNQLSRPMSRPVLTPSVAAAAPRLITNGNVRYRPVLRVRIPSYGSRVPALNYAPPGTQE